MTQHRRSLMVTNAAVRDGLLTVTEAIKFTRLSRSTLYNLMRTGGLRSVRIGRSRRISRRELLRLARQGY